jgi:8-hydroxy-5-deazaflavin:NADPH oxidoreductase
MRIGILGSGDVAKVLGSGFLKHGHEAMLGTSSPAKLTDWLAQNPQGSVGSFSEAALFGEVVVLALKGTAVVDVVRAAGVSSLAGKVVIDATNPITDAPLVNGVLKFFTGPNESLMEQLQYACPDARLVKAFNSVGAASMVNPQFDGVKPTMFICGNDASAKESVSAILDQFGWDAADMGTAVSARAIEPLCMLWCIRGFLNNEWTHAFKLLRR